MRNSAILLIQCPDRKGLDATLADFIYRHGGNILHFEQHQAGEEHFYLARTELDLKEFPGKFAPIVEEFSMKRANRAVESQAAGCDICFKT